MHKEKIENNLSGFFNDKSFDLNIELRKEVYQQTRSSSLAHIVLMSIFYLISKNYVNHNLKIIFIVASCVSLNLMRFFISIEYKKFHKLTKSINIRHDLAAIGSGICWGALFINTYLDQGLYTAPALALYVLVSGIAGGAVGSLSSQINIFIAFIISILSIPGMVMIYNENTYEQKLFGGLLIIYSFFLYVQSKNSRKNLIGNIQMSNIVHNEKDQIEDLFNSVPGITAFIDNSGNIKIANEEWNNIYPSFNKLSEIDFYLADCIYKFKNSSDLEHLVELELGDDFKNEIYLVSLKKMNHANGMIISLTNVTETKKTEIEVQRHKEVVQHNSRMIELGEMVGGVAHEINNPLSIALGKIFILKRQIEANTDEREKSITQLNELNIALDRISKIVSRMKSISRKSEDDPLTSESLDSILDVVKLMTSNKIKKHNVQFNSKDNDISQYKINCRASQIEQVLINLINNSVDAIEHLDEKWINLDIFSDHEKISICITDSGKGIPKEIISNIWNSFYTTKEAGKGTGLGLSIAKQIIDSHFGKIYIDTNCPNTRFVIELPKNEVNKAA